MGRLWTSREPCKPQGFLSRNRAIFAFVSLWLWICEAVQREWKMRGPKEGQSLRRTRRRQKIRRSDADDENKKKEFSWNAWTMLSDRLAFASLASSSCDCVIERKTWPWIERAWARLETRKLPLREHFDKSFNLLFFHASRCCCWWSSAKCRKMFNGMFRRWRMRKPIDVPLGIISRKSCWGFNKGGFIMAHEIQSSNRMINPSTKRTEPNRNVTHIAYAFDFRDFRIWRSRRQITFSRTNRISLCQAMNREEKKFTFHEATSKKCASSARPQIIL